MEMKENREIAVKLTGVKKRYRLGQIGGGSLRADLQSWWARIRKKEDPNLQIGIDQRLIGQTFMALNGIDLTIYQGEAVGIIGGNGAGKSTMLKLLSRVTAPTEGEIEINGRIASMLEVGTGFHQEMTGRENVYLNGAILGMTKAEIDAKMDQIIEFSEVKDFIDTPVKRYSSGMFVKLAFSVAAHLDAEIMIMDEVLAVGDVNFQQKCLKKMREAAKQDGRTVLYVSHNMSTIRQLCDRCIVLSKGRVIFEGDVEKAIEIYSGLNVDDSQLFTDLSQKDRPSNINGKYKMKSIELSDVTIDEENPLRFKLEIDSPVDSDNVVIRMVLLTGAMVATTVYSLPFSIKKGLNKAQFLVDSTHLAPGKYVVDLSVLEYEGNQPIRCDVIMKAFSFTVEEKEPMYNVKWSVPSHGYAKMPFMVELKSEDECRKQYKDN